MDDLSGPNVQIVLGVIEGQGFTFLHNPVFVTGSLNGHILESDSIGPCPAPVFATNLIWQADKKGLRLMRTGNIPMKVECFTINYQSRKERIGYLLLSLRSMQIVPTGKSTTIHQTWNKLLGVKNEAKALHPELLLSFHVEDDVNKNISPGVDEALSKNITKILPPSAIQGQIGTWRHPTLVPRLCSEEGLIQIGPDNQCVDIFLLSILIGTAVNLDMLLPETLVLTKDMEHYCFWYSIFGHSIQTKPFRRDIHQPCILNEKIVLRLRSSLEILKIYFTEVSLMSLKLLYGHDEIGNANMELKNLVPTEKLTEFLTRYAVNNTVTQNARCFLCSPSTGEVPTGLNGRRPYIEMEIKLKYIPTSSKQSTEEVAEKDLENTGQLTARSTTDILGTDMQRDVALRSTSLTGLEPKAVSNCYQEPTPRVIQGSGDYPSSSQINIFDQLSPRTQGQPNSASTGNIASPTRVDKCATVTQSWDSMLKPSLPLRPILSAASTGRDKNRSLIEAYHHYALNVSLESITFTKNLQNRKMEFRFHHPKAEIYSSSHPEITITEENETLCLQDIRCRLNFVSTPDEISRLLLAWPPKISVCDNKSAELPLILGETALDTSLLFAQEKHECNYSAKLFEPNSKNSLGQVNVTMYIEDCGLNVKKVQNETDQDLGPPILDERIAYKLVEELEDWKEKQQELFKSEMIRREEARLNLLNSEWQIRRADLEAKLCRGVEKCRVLARNLTKATDDLRVKAAKHNDAETRFKRLKEDMEQQYGLKHQDLREATRRLEEELSHKVNMTKIENTELVEKVNALERENALLKDTIKAHEHELSNLHKSTLTKDQTASLLQELRGVEEKLAASCKSKAFFKEEWGKTVREIHRMKAERQQQVQLQIRHNKEELSSLGLQDFINDELQMKRDQGVLNKIRSDLDCIHSGQSYHGSSNHFEFPAKESFITSRPDLLQMDSDEKAAMLIEERDALLRTGSYTDQDPIIIKLNQELQTVLDIPHKN